MKTRPNKLLIKSFVSTFLLTACNPLVKDADKSKVDTDFKPGLPNTGDSSQTVSTPSLSYATSTGISGTRGVAMNVTPSTVNAGSNATISNCTSATALPAWATLNSSTCVISGTPTTLLSSTAYSITITNSFSQTASASVTLEVSEDYSDNDNSVAGFSGGTHVGTAWDSTNSYVRLGSAGSCDATSTNCSNLDSSWTPQWSSLVSYWKMDNSWTDSKGSNNGTANGNATFTTSAKVGTHAGTFDGTGDYVNAGTSPNLSSTSFSVSAWVNYAVVPGSGTRAEIVSKYHASTPRPFGMYYLSGTLVFQYNSSTASLVFTPPANTWVHVVGVYDSAAQIAKVYVNGRKGTDSSTVAAIASDGRSLYIGAAHDGAATYFLNGKVDEVGLWTVALNEAAVQTIYSRQYAKYAGHYTSRVIDASAANSWDGLKWLTPLPFGKELTGDANNSGSITSADSETSTDYSSLVGSTGSTADNDLMSNLLGLWHLNQTAATAGGSNDFTDSSGKGGHGEQGGGTVFGALGLLDKGAYFDAVDDRIVVTAAHLANISPLSVSAWIMPRTLGELNVGRIVERSLFWSLGLRNTTANSLNFTVPHATTNLVVNTTANAITLGQWQHVALTWDGSTTATNVHIYVNGAEISHGSDQNGVGARSSDSSKNFYIGNNESLDVTFGGTIDEVAIWNRVLHANEIKQLYRRGANQIKFHVRSCTASDCSDDPTWLGSDGTNGTYISELHNSTSIAATGSPTGRVLVSFPDLLFSWFSGLTVPTNRYIQYRTILESDDISSNCNYGSGATWCSPELKSVEVVP